MGLNEVVYMVSLGIYTAAAHVAVYSEPRIGS